jgi:hypothetical protein
MYPSKFCKPVLLTLALLVGCTNSDRESLQGTVTLDGYPLAEGAISFRPQPGTQGPTAGAKIKDGTFTIASEEGTFTGTFRVEITASRKTGQQRSDQITGTMVDEYEQYLPARYNKESELIAEVTKGGKNEFPFELRSQ